MITHISIRARVALAVFALATIAIFVSLLARFGGPQVDEGRTVSATFADAQGLTQNADVLVRGVRVGHVASIELHGSRSTARLALDAGGPTLHRGAYATVGSKTPLGESFVALNPGRPAAPVVSGNVAIATRRTVQIDDALSVLDRDGQKDLRRVLASSSRALRSPKAAQQLSGTLAGAGQTAVALQALTGTLRGQEGQIAATVQNARSVLGEIGDHDASVRAIVRDGATTLQALAAARGSLGPSLDQAARLVHGTNGTLAEARPLIAEATPFAADMDQAAPHLTRALRALPQTSRGASELLRRMPALESAATPLLATAGKDLPAIGQAVEALGPDLQNVVPMLRYLAPRANSIAAWFSNTDALGQNGDAKGRWARFFVGFDPSTGFGLPGGPPGNSYTEPDDAAHNAAYKPGDFPRLMPFQAG